jgi:hypothetical protein
VRTALAALLALGLVQSSPALAADPILCPEGTKPGRSEKAAEGTLQWCERSGSGGSNRHGPMLGSYPSGRRRIEIYFVDGTPRGPIRAWYDSGQASAIGETRPDNGTLTLRDEAGRRRAQIDVRARQVVTQAWDADGREEKYEETKLAKTLAANRDLSFIMNIFAVGIGIQ